MSRTSIFVINNTGQEVHINNASGHIELAQALGPSHLIGTGSERVLVASIGDPGGNEQNTTGTIYFMIGAKDNTLRVKKHKKADAELLDYSAPGYNLEGRNDDDSKSIYHRAVTIVMTAAGEPAPLPEAVKRALGL